jgi:hypothetical protein
MARPADPMVVRLDEPDGGLQGFVLEPSLRRGCRVCRAVEHQQVDRGPGMARRRDGGSRAVSQRRTPWWRPRPPWNPWQLGNGFCFSAVTPIWFALNLLIAAVAGLSEVRAPDWAWITVGVLAVCDLIVSNVAGQVRGVLELCGARFDRRPALGVRPGNLSVWRVTS